MRGRNRFAGAFLTIWTAAAIAGALSAGRPYLHYLGQLCVPLACAAAAAVASLEEASHRTRWRLRLTWLVVAGVLLVPSLHYTLYQYKVYASMDNLGKSLGEQLARRLRPEDSVLVWGANPEIYWFANRRPATRFLLKYFMLGDSLFAERARREFLERTVAARPGAIVVPRNDPTTEDRLTSDEEWRRLWVPAFGSFLQGYTARETPPCTVYLRR